MRRIRVQIFSSLLWLLMNFFKKINKNYEAIRFLKIIQQLIYIYIYEAMNLLKKNHKIIYKSGY